MSMIRIVPLDTEGTGYLKSGSEMETQTCFPAVKMISMNPSGGEVLQWFCLTWTVTYKELWWATNSHFVYV